MNGGTIQNVISSKNYIGFNLGKAFYGSIYGCLAIGNVYDGFAFTTTGNSTVPPSTSTNGPLQWYVSDCESSQNGHDGFSYNVSGTAFGGSGVGSSVGCLESCKTFANTHHGVAYYGTSAHPLNSARLSGSGFFGTDLANEIYLDTYGRSHVLCGDFIEQAGQYGIQITANNSDTVIAFRQVSGCFWDGLYSLGNDTVVNGGVYVNNGVAGTGVANFAGIHIVDGSATINGVTSCNWNSTYQQYGILTAIDTIAVTGCRLPVASTFANGSGTVNGLSLSGVQIGNVQNSIYWVTGPTNSIVAGCVPLACNTNPVFSGGTVAGNLTVTGTLTAGTNLVSSTATHLNGPIALNGGVTLVSGASITGSTSGITVQDIQATRSAGVGSGGTADGVDGHLNVGTGILVNAATGSFHTGSINVSADVRINNTPLGGSNNFTGDVTITSGRLIIGGNVVSSTAGVLSSSGGLTVSGAITGVTALTASGQIQAQDLYVTRSIGLTTTPSGTAGHISGSPIAIDGASINIPNALAVSGAATFTGGVSISVSDLTMGGRSITGAAGITASGQIQGQDLYVTRSMGLGASPDGTTAHFAGPGGGIAFSGGLNVNVTGALAVTGSITASGGIGGGTWSINSTNGNAYFNNAGVGVSPPVTGTGILKLLPQAYASLISPVTAGQGSLSFITDSTTSGNYVSPGGGGATPILVQSEGVNWRTP